MTVPQPPTRHVLPSVMMRSGTSKGLFIHRQHLPAATAEWGPVLLSVMGSRNGDQKQIDGMGGGTSTTSKVAIISKSSRPDADVDYTFAQVAVGKGKVDFTGNCGNMASGVGPFALDEGMVDVAPGQSHVAVRVFNTNTQRLLVETIEVGSDGRFNEFGDYRIGGVKGAGSEIKVAFVEPAGSMTGKLLPTGHAQDTITIDSIPQLGSFTIFASLVDAANPFIFVDEASLPAVYRLLPPSAPDCLALVEAIRQQAAVMMGLASNTEEASKTRGTPKIAVLSACCDDDVPAAKDTQSIKVQSFSMGNPHPSFQLTGAVCLGAAVCTPGTIAQQLAAAATSSTDDMFTPPRTPPSDSEAEREESDSDSASASVPHAKTSRVRIVHSSGEMEVAVESEASGYGPTEVKSVAVSRTARRLFEGNVYYAI